MKFKLLFLALVAFSGCKEEMVADDPLTKPTGITIDNISFESFRLVWTSPKNATGYVVDIAEDEDFSALLPNYDGLELTNNQLEVMGLTESSTYYVRVKATNALESSPYSSTSEVTTLFYATSISVETSDDLMLHGSMRLPEGTGPHPVIIFSHSAGQSELEWLAKPLLKILYDEGYGILTFDTRSHGQSDADINHPPGIIGPLLSDPNGIPRDILAVYNFLTSRADIDGTRIGMVGSSMGANLTCIANGDESLDINTSVALSPNGARVEDLDENINDFQMSGIFYLAADGDGAAAQQAQNLFGSTNAPNKIAVMTDSDAHGTEILIDHPETVDDIFAWLADNL